MLIFAILVFASTLLVKRHLVLDVVTGIAVVEIGLFLARRTGAGADLCPLEPPVGDSGMKKTETT